MFAVDIPDRKTKPIGMIYLSTEFDKMDAPLDAFVSQLTLMMKSIGCHDFDRNVFSDVLLCLANCELYSEPQYVDRRQHNNVSEMGKMDAVFPARMHKPPIEYRRWIKSNSDALRMVKILKFLKRRTREVQCEIAKHRIYWALPMESAARLFHIAMHSIRHLRGRWHRWDEGIEFSVSFDLMTPIGDRIVPLHFSISDSSSGRDVRFHVWKYFDLHRDEHGVVSAETFQKNKRERFDVDLSKCERWETGEILADLFHLNGKDLGTFNLKCLFLALIAFPLPQYCWNGWHSPTLIAAPVADPLVDDVDRFGDDIVGEILRVKIGPEDSEDEEAMEDERMPEMDSETRMELQSEVEELKGELDAESDIMEAVEASNGVHTRTMTAKFRKLK
eukprot:TRINITY_DN1061_c0_g1_i8.p1 TRINITY_DN1061_c0_g1~~TRINITY_DN1061_c0_g1_i8.p1  ORF type:complete len:389 (-),score=77.37 TRINITY_DN1061_c0_g1_i8:8-1174(-)